MKASEKFAKRVLKKHNLQIPFDIESLVKEYADLEYKTFPEEVKDFDGVTIGLKNPNKKPKVYINSSQPVTRAKFTLAHELGHIIIPWHTGNIIDNISHDLGEVDTIYAQCEREADEFASELLLPVEWITSYTKSINEINQLKLVIEEISQITNLSYSAIGFKIIKYLKPGYVFIVTCNEGYIKWSKNSSSTQNRLDYNDKGKLLFDLDFYNEYKNSSFSKEVFGYIYFWFKTNSNIKIEFDENDIRSDKEILRTIVSDLSLESNYITSISSALPFCIDGLRRSGNLNLESLYCACIEKVENNSKYQWITKHKDYKTYVYKRSKELLNRL